jgi:hypothetical protein
MKLVKTGSGQEEEVWIVTLGQPILIIFPKQSNVVWWLMVYGV